MDIQTRKIEFVKEFLKIESAEVISKLEKILNKEIKNSDNQDLKPMSIEEFNSRIDESMSDSENGRMIKAVDLKAKMEKWS